LCRPLRCSCLTRATLRGSATAHWDLRSQFFFIFSIFSSLSYQIALNAAESVDLTNTVLLHAKQVANPGTPVLPTVTDGAIDWRELAASLNERLQAAPLLLEIASSAQLWSNIKQSVAYLTKCGFAFD
jgi:hypothetical protein